MTRATLARIIAAIVVLTVVMAVPMTQIHWNGTEASTQAHDIDTLLNVMIILSCFVFSIVLVMLGYCVWKYRAKPGDESDGEPIHGNTKLEITWTVIPTVIVLFGAIYSWIVLGNIESQAADDLKINVTAQQYEWTFNYPQPNGKAAGPHAHLAGRPSFVLGPGVADQARPGPEGTRGQRRRRHGGRDAGQGRHLQRRLYGALRLRPRDDARAREGGPAERVRDLAEEAAPAEAAPRQPEQRLDRDVQPGPVRGGHHDDHTANHEHDRERMTND
ncbi:MAG: cytochrome c oxidase subunit II [Actinobacteria bacterium]|nr:MAG: cytochrome c oxidase subunit II [Actinomycetota bacterium]